MSNAAEVLVMAIHGSPGDPKRAREEFAFLESGQRPLEILLLSDKALTVGQQLAGITQVHPGAALTVAPFLLGAGFHYQHDLLPALREQPGVRLLELFGRSDPFLQALNAALTEHAPRDHDQSLIWLVPGGAAVCEDLRAGLAALRPDLTARSRWFPLIKPQPPVELKPGATGLPLIAVLRDGRIAATLTAAWPGILKPRLLFEPRHLKTAMLSWTALPQPALTAV